MNTLDLFAGVGGIRLGTEQAGHSTVYSNDFEPKCQDTFNLNFFDPGLTIADIEGVDIDSLPEFDMITGGFPCQPFSVAGKRQGFKDSRGNLFFRIAQIIDRRKPRAFLLENVKGLLKHDGGDTFNTILATLYNLGYSIHWRVLNSKKIANIPHNRERLFIVGFKNSHHSEKFEWPHEIPLTQTVFDLLEPEVLPKYIINGTPLYEKVKDEITCPESVYQWRYNYVREHKHRGVCPCLVTVGKSPIIRQGDIIRHLTPKECFNLQGFPEGYKLPMIHDRHLYKQAGNSVTVPVIKRIADNIRICTT